MRNTQVLLLSASLLFANAGGSIWARPVSSYCREASITTSELQLPTHESCESLNTEDLGWTICPTRDVHKNGLKRNPTDLHTRCSYYCVGTTQGYPDGATIRTRPIYHCTQVGGASYSKESERHVEFRAWIGRGDDSGHLTMVDMSTSQSYEFTCGKNPTGIETKVIDCVTKMTTESKSNNLILGQRDGDECYSHQRKKTRKGDLRFVGLHSAIVRITQMEFNHLRKQIAVRFAVGSYNFVREAQLDDPLASRCLTMLEELAKFRGQRLKVGTANQLLGQFVKSNPDDIVEDAQTKFDFP